MYTVLMQNLCRTKYRNGAYSKHTVQKFEYKTRIYLLIKDTTRFWFYLKVVSIWNILIVCIKFS